MCWWFCLFRLWWLSHYGQTTSNEEFPLIQYNDKMCRTEQPDFSDFFCILTTWSEWSTYFNTDTWLIFWNYCIAGFSCTTSSEAALWSSWSRKYLSLIFCFKCCFIRMALFVEYSNPYVFHHTYQFAYCYICILDGINPMETSLGFPGSMEGRQCAPTMKYTKFILSGWEPWQ